MALEQVFLRVFRVFPVTVFSPMPLLIFIHILLLPEGQAGEACGRFGSSALSESGERWVERHFHFVLNI